MADAMTGTAAVNYDQAAYDRMVYFAFRSQKYFDNIADIKPTRQSMPGSAVVFTQQNDLALVTTPASETVDVDAVALSDAQVTVTLQEYVNAVNTTAKLRGTSFVEINPIVANVLGENAGASLDTIAKNIVVAGTNVTYGGAASSRVTVGAAMIITADLVRRQYALLQTARVPKLGGLYTAYIHPEVAYDLRKETGAAAWRDPHTYSAPNEIWNGEVGVFEGFRFIETPDAPLFVNAGVGGTVDVYGTIFVGKEAVAKTYSTTDGNGAFPKIIQSPVVDKARRFQPMAWYWLGGYGVFRQASIRRLETSSSIGAN